MLKTVDPKSTNTYGAVVCYYLSNSSELTVVLKRNCSKGMLMHKMYMVAREWSSESECNFGFDFLSVVPLLLSNYQIAIGKKK